MYIVYIIMTYLCVAQQNPFFQVAFLEFETSSDDWVEQPTVQFIRFGKTWN